MRMHGFVGVVVALLSCASFAAQQRSFVASTGSDANPCNLAQPCRTFGVAVGQTFDGGEVIVLDSAGYGPVTVTKSVTIVAPPGVYAGIYVLSGNGVTINGGVNISLVGLTIIGQPFVASNGIAVLNDAVVAIERCRVSGMANGLNLAAFPTVSVRGSTFTLNTNRGVTGTGHLSIQDTAIDRNSGGGIYMFGGTLSLVNSTINFNDFSGLYVFGSSGSPQVASMDRSVVHGNAIGGIVVRDADSALTLARTLVEGNGYAGMEVSGYATVTDSVVARNGGAGIITSSAGARVTLESAKVTDNSNFGVKMLAGVVQTLQNNTIANNAPGDVSGGALAPIGLQ